MGCRGGRIGTTGEVTVTVTPGYQEVAHRYLGRTDTWGPIGVTFPHCALTPGSADAGDGGASPAIGVLVC